MGWYDASYADADQLAEAKEAEDALSELSKALEEKNPQPMHKWAEKMARCLGPTVDVRLSMVEFATIEDDAMGMEETRGDHAAETDGDEAAEMQAKADAWGSVALSFGRILKDLNRRARKAGCR
jgi:hypothetical protein